MFKPLFLVLFWSLLVVAIPTFDGAPGRSSIGSLVPGAAPLQALRAGHNHKAAPRHLNVRTGELGNLSTTIVNSGIPLYYIHRGRLWQYVNETTIFHVNVINGTSPAPGTEEVPLQLVLDNKLDGVTSGSWRFRGTMLFYDLGPKTNSGVYYDCLLPSGGSGLLMFLKGVPTPHGCNILTLHAFNHDI